jgi:16S rRNA (guanine966-N2)-methyltransferase
LIAKNLALCGLQSQGVLVRKDLMRGFPRRHRAAEEKADLAFVDPPYRKNMILAVLEELAGLNLLAPEATVVAQSEQKEVLPPGVGCLHGVKSRVYGDTRITLYRNEGEL